MTLLELLVQELPKRGGWPEGVHSITQDDNGSLFLWEISGAYPKKNSWRHPSGCGLLDYWCGERAFKRADDRISAYISAEQYAAALAASKQHEWDGEGLPPVGMKVEWLSEIYGWIDGTVAGHDEKYPQVAIIRHNGGYAVCNRHEIRTEAERRREEVGLAIYHAINWNAEGELVSPSRMEDYRKAYDAIAAGKIPGIKLAD